MIRRSQQINSATLLQVMIFNKTTIMIDWNNDLDATISNDRSISNPTGINDCLTNCQFLKDSWIVTRPEYIFGQSEHI